MRLFKVKLKTPIELPSNNGCRCYSCKAQAYCKVWKNRKKSRWEK